MNSGTTAFVYVALRVLAALLLGAVLGWLAGSIWAGRQRRAGAVSRVESLAAARAVRSGCRIAASRIRQTPRVCGATWSRRSCACTGASGSTRSASRACSASCAVRPRPCPTAWSCSIRRAKSSGSTARPASCSTCRGAPIWACASTIWCAIRISCSTCAAGSISLPVIVRIDSPVERHVAFQLISYGEDQRLLHVARCHARSAPRTDAQGFRRECLARAALAADRGRRISRDLRRRSRNRRTARRRSPRCGARPIA